MSKQGPVPFRDLSSAESRTLTTVYRQCRDLQHWAGDTVSGGDPKAAIGVVLGVRELIRPLIPEGSTLSS